MHDFLMDQLVCPACHGALTWTIEARHGDRIEQGTVRCTACAASYSVREGIGVFLTPDLPRDDLWEQVARLDPYLREHPDLERQLMDVPPETLGPADQFLRVMVLEERGQYAEAVRLANHAFPALYTPEYLACAERQYDYVLRRLESPHDPVVDLASGRGALVERLANHLTQPIVATDFSPRVLRRNRRVWQEAGLLDRISLLAFDAQRTPFKAGAIPTLTTHQGLSNIKNAAGLWRELRRIVSGTFWAISYLFPDGDEANGAAIRQAGLEGGLLRGPLFAALTDAGWKAESANSCIGLAKPTPSSVILDGVKIDGLPVAETMLDWCTLVAV
jgi:uncharacterized protein YbaR (Trm112 family)